MSQTCRTHPASPKSDSLRRGFPWPVCLLGGLTVISVAVMLVVLCLSVGSSEGQFTPPPFDPEAVAGSPSVADSLGYWSPYQPGMAYRFSLCGSPVAEGETATVYFTNWPDNTVYLKLRLLDAEGNVLGDTGLLRPGEYVRGIRLVREIPAGSRVTMKVMSYDPETYWSEGSVSVHAEMGGKP